MTSIETTDARGLVLSGIDAGGAEIYDSFINDSYERPLSDDGDHSLRCSTRSKEILR